MANVTLSIDDALLQAAIDAEPPPAGRRLPRETRGELYDRLLSERSPKR